MFVSVGLGDFYISYIVEIIEPVQIQLDKFDKAKKKKKKKQAEKQVDEKTFIYYHLHWTFHKK